MSREIDPDKITLLGYDGAGTIASTLSATLHTGAFSADTEGANGEVIYGQYNHDFVTGQ